jgi:uncharacterized protein YqjF (DUF2071 family)
MNKISDLLKNISHRPYGLPDGPWQYYQEWNEVLFLHWAIPLESLRKFVPKELDIDTFNGKAYISLVPFSMKNIRPRYWPAISFVSDFHEINIRTYVSKQNQHGVFFLKIEAEKLMSVLIARNLSALPYKKSIIKRQKGQYISTNKSSESKIHVHFKVGDLMTEKNDLDKFLTERYCLFLEKTGKIFRYDIQHKEWPLKSVEVTSLEIYAQDEVIDLISGMPELCHYSEGVQVLSWRKLSL